MPIMKSQENLNPAIVLIVVGDVACMKGTVYALLSMLDNSTTPDGWRERGKSGGSPKTLEAGKILKWIKDDLENTLREINEVLVKINPNRN